MYYYCVVSCDLRNSLTEYFVPLEPPAYESLQLIDTNTTPPYPGMDIELPNYCEVVTQVVVHQVSNMRGIVPQC